MVQVTKYDVGMKYVAIPWKTINWLIGTGYQVRCWDEVCSHTWKNHRLIDWLIYILIQDTKYDFGSKYAAIPRKTIVWLIDTGYQVRFRIEVCSHTLKNHWWIDITAIPRTMLAWIIQPCLEKPLIDLFIDWSIDLIMQDIPYDVGLKHAAMPDWKIDRLIDWLI